MALASVVRPGTPLQLIAGAHAEGSAFTRMLTGLARRSVTMPVDPRLHGMGIGAYIVDDDLRVLGRVESISDNGNADDWLTGDPTEWYVTVERPWNQTSMNTTLGKTKIEWLEDTMFPRTGRVIECDPASYFRLGDIVRFGGEIQQERRAEVQAWWQVFNILRYFNK